MKIAIIGAMEEEVTILHKKIEQCQQKEHAGSLIYTGKLHGVDVALARSGIGKVAAAVTSASLFDYFNPDCVINTGSAGGLDPSLNIGDIVISDEVRYHDADVTAFGYELGQLPSCPPAFSADSRLINIAETCINNVKLHAVRGLICSGDRFVNGSTALEQIKTAFPKIIAVEMEAAAIGHVCYLYQLPFVVVRAISDIANKEAHLSFDEFLVTAAKQSSLIVENMVQELARHP